MKTNFLAGRDFLTLNDFSTQEIQQLLTLSAHLKQKKAIGIKGDLLLGKNSVLIFDKHSTRTRCAFEVAAFDEGGCVTFLTNSHIGIKESIEDTAKVLSRFYDGIQYRGAAHRTVENLAKHATVPVWNGLTDRYHPTQILADCLTIQEHCNKPLNQIKLVFVGDTRNNMGNSLMIGAAKLGFHFVALAPAPLLPDSQQIEAMQSMASETGGNIEVCENIDQAVTGADVLYTDVWASMGEEEKLAERIKLLLPYQVNESMLAKTGNPDTRFMHCLPACHDRHTKLGAQIADVYRLEAMEVSDALFRSPCSVVFDQAENRLHTIKAVMVATMGRGHEAS
ncbi:MAG: ornithine carbamoyltransferase [Gammaproteobacteria bacterium]|nr:ornithine carbamoyltransferase [Gammaproteobacteria bacterium]